MAEDPRVVAVAGLLPGSSDRFGDAKRILEAADEAALEEDVRKGRHMEGGPGSLFRLMAKIDYMRIEKWMSGEIIRGTLQDDVLETVAIAVSSMITLVVGKFSRKDAAEVCVDILGRVVSNLDKDMKAVAKTGVAIRRDGNGGIAIVSSRDDGRFGGRR